MRKLALAVAVLLLLLGATLAGCGDDRCASAICEPPLVDAGLAD